MTTEHNKATPEGNVTCCPHVSDGASSTKEPHNPRHFPRSVRLPAAAQPLSSSPHGSTRLLAKFPVCRTALLAYWINLLLLGITLYFSGVCAEETGVVQDEMPRDVPTAIKRRIVIGQGLYAFGALLCVVSTYLSIAFIVLVQLNYAIAPRFARRPRS